MKAAVVKNAAMNKDIFLKLIGRDKAIAPQIIEEFDHGTNFIFSGLCGRWW